MRKILSLIGYSLWTLGCLGLFTVLLLPYKPITALATSKLNASTDAVHLQAQVIKPLLWPVGLKAKNLQLLHPGKMPQEEDRSLLTLDSFRVHASPFALLAKSWRGKAKATLGKAKLRVKGRFGLDQWKGELKLRNLPLSELPLAGSSPHPDQPPSWEVKGSGNIQIDADIDLDREHLKNGSGSFSLDIDDLILDQTSVKGFTLPKATFSKTHLEARMANGRIEIQEGVASSDRVDAEVSGNIVLNQKLSRSRLNLKVRFRFADDLKPLVQGIMGSRMRPDEEGWYQLDILRTLGRPLVRPTGTRVRSRGGDRAQDRAGGRSSGKRRDKGLEGNRMLPSVKEAKGMTPEEREQARQKALERRKKDQQARRERFDEMRKKRESALGAIKNRAPLEQPLLEQEMEPEYIPEIYDETLPLGPAPNDEALDQLGYPDEAITEPAPLE